MATTVTEPAESAGGSDAVGRIIAYHDRTKHRPGQYARGPDGMDWANQPNPFRRFTGAPSFSLPLAASDDTPPAHVVFGVDPPSPRPLTWQTLGLFFELSLGLSARKETPGSSWYLRVNPSSGNLHPTEAYAILPTRPPAPNVEPGLNHPGPGKPGVFHYAPLDHALELRSGWADVASPDCRFWVGLTSITWREAWKYGERAFRYCQHDIGHALAALRFAATALGWRVRWISRCPDTLLAELLGLAREEDFAGAEIETPELLAEVLLDDTTPSPGLPTPAEPVEWFGRANRLSSVPVPWSAIDQAVAASKHTASSLTTSPTDNGHSIAWPPPQPPQTDLSAGQLLRQRRSAVAFDGQTQLSRERFLNILDTTLPRSVTPPFDAWPFAPRIHLVLFLHRVIGLEPGLYLWLRNPAALGDLKAACRADFLWKPISGSSNHQPLYQLGEGALHDFARAVSCHQDIAADSAFSLGMLARFESTLRDRTAAAYRELFWEAGMIGQSLYLAAEAAGVRGTGIGCYFDDALHDALGLSGHAWQSLYHFTLGGPVEDGRLRTSPPYAHLRDQND